SRERGEFFHAAMEGFTRSLPENAAWPRVTRKECDAMMDAALRPLTAAWEEKSVIDTARARAESQRYVSVCKRVAWAFTKGAAQSCFRPSRMEVAFGYPGGPPPIALDLPDGTRVLVRGRIDRVDRFDSGAGVYLRVVDYKSGDQRLDPARIYVGMQLQLLLYLEAALQAEPGALPAGAFYQWMGDPLVDQEKKSVIESELAKRLCLKGVMLSDVEVARWMDSGDPPIGIEDVFKKDGTPKKGKLVCTLEELTRLIDSAHETAVRLTEEIRRGGIAASPVVDRSSAAHCQYCAFAGVCRRDPQNRSQDRPLPRMTLQEAISAQPEPEKKQ
ncbi:MAG: PD-(D/E)XK nuclease family protein, partial [Clostridia bacterium]|nr:PD-(D/E)XK nuclease family protein [Clostridia bacterium]